MTNPTPQWAQIARFEPHEHMPDCSWIIVVTPTGEHALQDLGSNSYVRDALGLDPEQPVNPMALEGPDEDGQYRRTDPDGTGIGLWRPAEAFRARGWHVPEPGPTPADAAWVLERCPDGEPRTFEDARIIKEALRRMADGGDR